MNRRRAPLPGAARAGSGGEVHCGETLTGCGPGGPSLSWEGFQHQCPRVLPLGKEIQSWKVPGSGEKL